IVPYNSAGEAIGCSQETFSTLLGCGPYLDPNLGELVSFSPEIDFPELVSFCQNESPFVISTEDTADGYRWYRTYDFGSDELISETNEVSLLEEGTYRYEAYNYIDQLGATVECLSSQNFEVVSSEPATVDGLIAQDAAAGLDLTVLVSGIGDYEFAINDRNGPYQDSNTFSGLPIDAYTIYIRDKNGCGIVEERFSPDIRPEGFPPFFTPNGDGINDYWQFVPPLGVTEINLDGIMIFDRIGNLLAQIDPLSQGWDGTFNGRPLPANTYWFKAMNGDKKPLVGFFTLKR
ncbi:MAG: T9SS type B sorting domain-containing protein, partial [Bacteroidia bacterium]|nr:T9SS type B sorting domain-containing protein [Bacteroidia bacterium]